MTPSAVLLAASNSWNKEIISWFCPKVGSDFSLWSRCLKLPGGLQKGSPAPQILQKTLETPPQIMLDKPVPSMAAAQSSQLQPSLSSWRASLAGVSQHSIWELLLAGNCESPRLSWRQHNSQAVAQLRGGGGSNCIH